MTLPSAKTNKFMVTMGLAILMLLAFSLTGFSIVNMAPHESVYLAAPNPGEESPGRVNVIKNGGFEETDENSKPPGVARYWNGYTNGQAIFGFYDEQWPEAVLNGKHAQLLEINLVEANILDRVIAVHQTVGVSANSQYDLTLWAIMRTQAPEIDRNKSEVEMHWGVDFSGAGDYNNVTEWHLMPLTEQYRLGSTGKYPEDIPLRYEMVTGTIQTGANNQITLFIRGLKKFPTGTEVDFNIDDVSLIGAAGGPAPTATPTLVPGATPEMPTSGAITSENTSVGSVLLGGLVLVALGSTAAFNLLRKRHWS